jgi:cobalt-zinc-cadmium efflux system outer membrane protein
VPARETAVRETQKQVNYMLVGVFELLRAKRQQIDAYQSYLEAVRDYWQARADLRRAVGTRLPDDVQPLEPVPGIDEMDPRPDKPAHEHHHHGQGAAP